MRQHKFTWIAIIKNFTIDLPQSLDFATFLLNLFYIGGHIFLVARLFWAMSSSQNQTYYAQNYPQDCAQDFNVYNESGCSYLDLL